METQEGKIQETWREFREYSGNIQGTLEGYSGNLGNMKGNLRGHFTRWPERTLWPNVVSVHSVKLA
jgi:hypothetical protein